MEAKRGQQAVVRVRCPPMPMQARLEVQVLVVVVGWLGPAARRAEEAETASLYSEQQRRRQGFGCVTGVGHETTWHKTVRCAFSG